MKASRRIVLYLTVFLPVAAGIFLLFLPSGGSASASSGHALSEAETPAPEQLVFLLQYLGTDYPGAVRDGQILNLTEYQEMVDFSGALVEEYRRLPGQGVLLARLEQMQALIAEKAAPVRVRDLSHELVSELANELNVIVYPSLRPDLDRGRKSFSENCARCHGMNGNGQGPSAAGLDPAPSSFTGDRMNDISPLQIYNAISLGVQGTDMPSHRDSLSEQQRWDTAFYVMTLRRNFSPAVLHHPQTLTLQQLSAHSNSELMAKDGAAAALSLAEMDQIRNHPPGPESSELLKLAVQRLEQSLESYRKSEVEAALRLSLDAYMGGIEPVEPQLMNGDSGRIPRIERQFALYRKGLRSQNDEQATQALALLKQELREAERELASSEFNWGLVLVQSLAIILREGIEAALLLGIMLTYLAASGHQKFRKYVVGGALAGILLGFVTWFLARFLLWISPLQQEALEGITSLLAAAVLFSISFWIIHNADVRQWKQFIKLRAEEALGGGSGIALGVAAFLAVYREAFETVLFYQALWLRSRPVQSALWLGLLVGTVILAVTIYLMFRFGLRIPLKQFFAVTGVLLGLLSFSFAGYGVRELQTIGWLKQTPLPWMIELPLLEIQPTLEGCALQIGILVSFLLGWFSYRRIRLGVAPSAASS